MVKIGEIRLKLDAGVQKLIDALWSISSNPLPTDTISPWVPAPIADEVTDINTKEETMPMPTKKRKATSVYKNKPMNLEAITIVDDRWQLSIRMSKGDCFNISISARWSRKGNATTKEVQVNSFSVRQQGKKQNYDDILIPINSDLPKRVQSIFINFNDTMWKLNEPLELFLKKILQKTPSHLIKPVKYVENYLAKQSRKKNRE